MVVLGAVGATGAPVSCLRLSRFLIDSFDYTGEASVELFVFILVHVEYISWLLTILIGHLNFRPKVVLNMLRISIRQLTVIKQLLQMPHSFGTLMYLLIIHF